MGLPSGDQNISTPASPTTSEGFRKLRVVYALLSGLLILWRIAGFKFTKPSILGQEIDLETAQAFTPWILVVSVLYCAYVFTLDWYSSNSQATIPAISRVDLIVAHCLGAGSLLVVLFYAILKAQTVRLSIWTSIAAFFAGISLVQTVMLGRHRAKHKSVKATHYLYCLIILIAVLISYLEGQLIVLAAFGVGLIFGTILPIIVSWFSPDSA